MTGSTAGPTGPARPADRAGREGPERLRIAAVHGTSQGSGYLLSPRLVLTAGHLVTNRYTVNVAALGGVGEVKCRVVWSRDDRECDAALLLAGADLLPAEDAEALAQRPVLWGMPLALETMDSCQAIGFPQVQRGDGEELDTEQIVGTFKPGSRMVRARYVLDSPHTPPAGGPEGSSPWAGMSGAALFAEGTIIGVVVADPHGWQHGRLEAVRSRVLFDDPDFTEQLVRHTGHRPTVFDFGGTEHHPHAEFERRYADYIAEYHSELTIFGLDFTRQEHAQWPLDTAYLSLELAPHHSREHGHGPGGGQDVLFHDTAGGGGGRKRVESAFSRETRILLRGFAGSGKTTLVQWLAVTAARQDFPHGLGHFQGCVPFVLPLRTLARRESLPEPHEFLAAVGNPLASLQPEGWADQVLKAGRGLLLIDGVDEVRERDRERTQEWLKRLITLYQDCIYLVTTRPSAVVDGWLHHQDFTELNLLPMNRQDVTAFLDRWHEAAAETVQRSEDKARLETYRSNLTDVLPRKPDLARLATNPLMCAMICALNRDRDSYLPQNRLELYRAALSMLLVRRDVQRELPRHEETSDSDSRSPSRGLEALRQDEDAQRLLLQDLAYWMIRNGHVEADRPEASRIVAQTLRSMPQIAPPEKADAVLEYLLLRCGLLRAPSPETLEFVHRTFQDYLGAKAAVEGQDLNLVAAHAHEPQWEDVVRMAIGHARAGERAVLLRRLLELGDAAVHPQRERLHLLAAACLEHATSLDPGVRAEVEQRASALVPPWNLREAEMLAATGTVALDLMPPPEALTAEQALPVTHTARLIGGEHAFQVLRAFWDSTDVSVRQELANAWDRFEARTYAEDVLSRMSFEGVRLSVSGHDQLAALPLVGHVQELHCVGNFGADELTPALRSAAPGKLILDANDRLADLEFLPECVPELSGLWLTDCGGLVDYSALPRLGLRVLALQDMPGGPDLTPLREATTLREATLAWLRSGPARRLSVTDVPFASTLEKLHLFGNLVLQDLSGIARVKRLTHLHLPQAPTPMRELGVLDRLPALRTVDLTTIGMCRSADRHIVPLGNIAEAVVKTHESGSHCTTEALRRMFPSVRSLHLTLVAGWKTTHVDLSALAGIPDLSVLLLASGRKVRVTGTEDLPHGSVLTQARPSPGEPKSTPWRRRLRDRE